MSELLRKMIVILYAVSRMRIYWNPEIKRNRLHYFCATFGGLFFFVQFYYAIFIIKNLLFMKSDLGYKFAIDLEI